MASPLDTLGAVNGWRLFLYALLGTWVVSATGSALSEIIHGRPDYAGAIKAALDDPHAKAAPASSAPPAAPGASSPPKVAGVSGFDGSELDDLAEALAATYGALPPELIPRQAGQGLEVGTATPWVAGMLAAVAAVGIIAWRLAPGMGHEPTLDVKPLGPLQVTPTGPVKVDVAPDLSKVKLPDVGPLAQQLLGGGGAPGGKGGGAAPAMPAQAQQLLGGLSQFLQGQGQA